MRAVEFAKFIMTTNRNVICYMLQRYYEILINSNSHKHSQSHVLNLMLDRVRYGIRMCSDRRGESKREEYKQPLTNQKFKNTRSGYKLYWSTY